MTSTGAGDAHAAAVETTSDEAAPADLMGTLTAEADARVAGAQSRLEKAQGHLAGAKEALAAAVAARKELK